MKKQMIRELYHLLKKFDFVHVDDFEKGENITSFIKNRSNFYFILVGKAQLIRNTKSGDEIMIDIFKEDDFFSESFYDFKTGNELLVIAKQKCRVLCFDINYVDNLKASDILFNLIRLEMKELNFHTILLNEKSIRSKLLYYFEHYAIQKEIQLKISYVELAAYLCVNRSAMMKELSLMEKEHVISRNKKTIKLLL